MKKKQRVKMKNGIAKWLRSPDGPKKKVEPDKKKQDVARRARAFDLKEKLMEEGWDNEG